MCDDALRRTLTHSRPARTGPLRGRTLVPSNLSRTSPAGGSILGYEALLDQRSLHPEGQALCVEDDLDLCFRLHR